jgi:hypothetical protein
MRTVERCVLNMRSMVMMLPCAIHSASCGMPPSPYLLWRIETYCGVKMTQIGFLEFWEFMWRERKSLWRFLKWTGEMERYAHPKPKNP